jgi:hypothetical protein
VIPGDVTIGVDDGDDVSIVIIFRESGDLLGMTDGSRKKGSGRAGKRGQEEICCIISLF